MNLLLNVIKLKGTAGTLQLIDRKGIVMIITARIDRGASIHSGRFRGGFFVFIGRVDSDIFFGDSHSVI
jgi:hypothetical protein